MNSDRIFGLVIVLGALAIFAGALQVRTSFLSDPLGPKAFPILISGFMVLAGLSIALRPDSEPDWPQKPALMRMLAALAILVGYAYALPPFGFLVPTALAASGISYLIRPNPGTAALTGAGLSAVLFVIFKYGLGLGLAPLPRALMG